MPFTHSYSSSNVAASASYGNRGGHILSPSSSSSSIDAASSRHAGSSRSATTVDSPSPSEHDSARSRLFSSGRKSPDPFRRFRRLSSNNSLNIASQAPMLDSRPSLDSQQNQPSPYNDTRIPPYPTSTARPASPAPLLDTPRSVPPPLPSPSTKPVFQRPKRTKSSSISILSTGLGLRSKDILHPPSSSSDARRRHRKSASLSGSDVDFSSSTIEPPRAVTPQPLRRPASPSPSLSESIYSVHHDSAAARSAPAPPASAAYTSKQHKQAWYQAQQKTIELENPNNRGAPYHDSDTAKLFPLNVTTSASTTSTPTANDNADRGRGSPADSRSPRPVVETFLSEEEMLAAGIHIIRRRVEEPTTTSDSSKRASEFTTPQLNEHAAAPAMPPRLYGADHPDFLELIDSPIGSKQPSPLLEQLIDPPASSASMQRAISHSHAKSNSGSLSISSSSSTDYLPYSNNHHDDASSLHNGSTGSLSSGSKHSFSFAKLRRAGTKQSNAGGSSRPSTANSSSNEDVTSNRSFLFPPRGQQALQQPQHHADSHHASSSGAVAPGYLSPGPGASASPFLNKHSATVGRASGSLGATHTAKNGLTQVFNGTGSSAATIGPSSSATRPYHTGASNGVPPPKPPKPKPSLLATFPRTTNNSMPGSSSAPNTAKLYPSYDSDRHASNARDLLRVPHSAEIGGGNGIYGSIAHSRSQEAVAEARLDAEALRASAGTPLPPPRRLNATRGGYGGAAGASASGYSSTAMGRSTSGGASGVVGALGHVGQFGAAMGRKGWDFMKTFQSSANASSTSAASVAGRGGSYASGYRSGGVGPAAANEPTRQWLMFLEGPDLGRNTSAGVFGAPLKDVVLRSRLSSIATDTRSNDDHLGVPDLGKEFSANFLESPRITPRASLAGTAGQPLSRDEARHLLLPRIVVRCIESLEKWGPSEEGIYRISGRSSHTAKLRAFFSDPHNDLHLDEINPADLDINSVCSLLKSYLRELPDTLLPLAQSKALDQSVARLFAETDEVPSEAVSGSGGKVTDARAALIPAEKVGMELGPLVRQLPVYNWYLLRELAYHLGLLAQPDVVARTKMPISNLTLVLAPTVSISLPVLQVLVRHREVVFAGPAPSEDVAVTAVSALASPPASAKEAGAVRSGPPPKPAKPEKLSSPSRLPVMVRKRASSMGLGALLSSPTSKTAPEKSTKRQHTRTSSTTPSLELPAGIGESLPSSPASKYPPSSPSVVDEPYERPSTSLGHFADSPSRRPSSHRRFGSRDAALRFNALALDDPDREEGKGEETPIARYYARIREDAERDGAKTPLATGSGELRRYWAEKTSSSTPLSPDTGRSGRTSALDRPRPPTSSTASFFSGRSRRQDSVNGLAASSAQFSQEGSTKPLNIVKKGQGQRSASSNGSADGGDVDRTPRLGYREQREQEREEEQEESSDVTAQIRRYLESGPAPRLPART